MGQLKGPSGAITRNKVLKAALNFPHQENYCRGQVQYLKGVNLQIGRTQKIKLQLAP